MVSEVSDEIRGIVTPDAVRDRGRCLGLMLRAADGNNGVEAVTGEDTADVSDGVLAAVFGIVW